MNSSNRIERTGQLLLALVLGLAALQAFAADTAATVLFSHGAVTVIDARGSHPLNKGDTITADDIVHTGANGRVQMRFTDGGLVSLMPESRFVVEEYIQPTANNDGSLVTHLVKGGLRALSGTIGHEGNSSYKLKTAVATLGIRGTQYIATVHEGSASANTCAAGHDKVMRVHVGHGAVSLTNEYGELLVEAGQNARVLCGQAPELSPIAPQFTSLAILDDTKDDGNRSRERTVSATPERTDRHVRQTLPTDFIGNRDFNRDQNSGPGQNPGTDPNPGPGQQGNSGFAQTTLALEERPYTFVVNKHSSVSHSNPTKDPQTLAPDDITFTGPDLTDVAIDPPDVHKTGNLVWGYIKSITPDNPASRMAYAFGRPATNLPTTGTLHYQLVGSPKVISGLESPYTLQKFSMSIKLGGAPRFKVNNFKATSSSTAPSIKFHMDQFTEGTWTGPSSFKFRDANVFISTSSGNFPICESCALDAAGILVGKDAAQAGVTYVLHRKGEGKAKIAAGVAPLKKK